MDNEILLSQWYQDHQEWLDSGGECGIQADLRRCDLQYRDLRYADLTAVDLRHADLCNADLRDAILRTAELENASLQGADLRGANLQGACLVNANLKHIKVDYTTIGIHPAPEGELVVWGKKSGHIVKMLVRAAWKRSCATTRKHRSEAVLVLEIDDGAIESFYHRCYAGALYEVGEVTQADSWDENRWHECSNGIHWFLSRAEAEAWDL